MWKKLRGFDKDDLLEMVGLETRRSTAEALVPALAMFGLGVIVGAGIGLMLAPKSGAELRQDLRTRFQTGRENVSGLPSSSAGARTGAV